MLFADFLNCAMTQAGLTNYKLAKRLDISQTTVANWLDGTTEPRSKKRKDVLALFGVTEQDLEAGQFEIIYSEDAEQKEKPALPEEGELDSDTAELLEAWNSSEEAKSFLLSAARMIKSRREDQ